MTPEELAIPLDRCRTINPKTAQRLIEAGFSSVRDLLYYFPVRYEDLTRVTPIAEIPLDQPVLLIGQISGLKIFRTPRRGMAIINATLTDDSGKVRIMWFNQSYLLRTLAGEPRIAAWGKVSKGKFGKLLTSPHFRVLPTGADFKPKIQPIYSEAGGISSALFEKTIRDLLAIYPVDELDDPLPETIRKRYSFPGIGEALQIVHDPPSLTAVEQIRRRLAFESLFYLQLKLLQQKQALSHERAPLITVKQKTINEFLSGFDFSLTAGQKDTVRDILLDLHQSQPMNRLLQGEVGSGKTLVAELAALAAIDAGYQALIMAPTEILARQHFERTTKDFSRFDTGVGFLTSSGGAYGHHGFTAKKSQASVLRLLAQQRIQLLVGTHSLLECDDNFSRVALIVIDEQQRFGVNQRKKLVTLASIEHTPHVLSMSATPIPRTLALAVYGDMDLSVIREQPVGRKPVTTYLVRPDKREQAWEFVRAEIKKGHQAFIICPRVEVNAETRGSGTRINADKEIKTVKEEYLKIKKIFAGSSVAMLHGKLKPIEKERVLHQLQQATIQVLVSSSVVEVGIDLPLATTIIIEGAERFGLSQLHQLRGRVGRSIHQSYCFLVMEDYTPLAYQRLKAVKESNSALELAEKDLELRGAGEFMGERQAGVTDLAMEAIKDTALVQAVRTAATALLQQNPKLDGLPLLQQEVNRRNVGRSSLV